MRQKGLISVRRRKFKPQTTDSNHNLPIAEGWLYLTVIIDLFSRRVIGWATSSSLRAERACRALEMALIRRGRPSDFVYHSDRGVQYASELFRNDLARYNIAPSMSRKGNCYDNAVAESFFDTLKVELVHRHRFASREVARTLIIDFIEEFYNQNRIHSTLGFISPADYESLFTMPRQSCVH